MGDISREWWVSIPGMPGDTTPEPATPGPEAGAGGTSTNGDRSTPSPEAQIWDLIGSHRITQALPYQLGFGRMSCTTVDPLQSYIN